MKKNFILAAASCAVLFGAAQANAQDFTETALVVEETPVTLVNVDCKDNYSASWRDNWYLQLGAGIQAPFVDYYLAKGDPKRHMTPVYSLGVGHWFSPYLGFRISAMYGRMHWDFITYQKASLLSGNVDLTWDMFNSLGGVNPNRVFSIVPFVGIGGTYTWDFKNPTIPAKNGDFKTKQVTLPVSAGLQLRFRVCKYVDIFGEVRAQFYGDNFNNTVAGDPIECNLAAIGGFAINFGGSGNFTKYNPCEYIDYINGLNNQINDLRAGLAATTAALAAAEAQLPCPEVTEAVVINQAPLMSTVRFKINSDKISEEEMVNVYNMAQWMKANPGVSVVISGYADKDTGSSTYNMSLSERRAQAVYDVLTNSYGIDPSLLIKQANGSDVQPYDVNNWNRIVMFAQPQ